MFDTAYFLSQFEKELEAFRQENIKGTPIELYEPISYILSLGGKKLRPLLVLMGSNLFDGNISLALPSALSVEVFHNFTLMHDDIMDNAPMRRSKPTVHEKWNQNIAILSGDAMLVKAYQILLKSDKRFHDALLNIFNETALQVCEGQQMDMNFEKLPLVSIPLYIKMITLKTAVLLGASLKMGAICGGAREEDAQSIYEFGKNIGIAFQLQDDILDVYGNEKNFGKRTGGDIIANKKTFLVLKSLEIANRYMKEELETWLNSTVKPEEEVLKIDAVTKIFNFLNIREIAKKEAEKFFDKALSSIESLPVSKEKKMELTNFASALLVREI